MVSVTFKEIPFRKTCILDMYSPNTIKKVKIAYLTTNFFWLSAVSDSTDGNTFSNIFAKSKPNSKIVYGVNLEPIWGRLTRKTRGQKSHATVPLTFSSLCVCTLILSNTLLEIKQYFMVCLERANNSLQLLDKADAFLQANYYMTYETNEATIADADLALSETALIHMRQR